MYVCICNALTDRDVKGAASQGARRASEVYRHCGCEPRCGRCKPFIRGLLEGAASDDGSAPAA